MTARVIAAVVLWLVLCAVPVVGQELAEPPAPIEPTLSDEVILLRLDLMAQRSETIQARSDRLVAERQLLEMDIQNFRVDQATLQAQLDAHCGSPYDMATRRCTPVPVAPDPIATDEDDPS